jgi:urease accessory protein
VDDRSESALRRQHSDALAALRLLHLADSALPIGSLAHSFGIESLSEAGMLQPQDLEVFFRAYLEEAGVLEAVFCRAAFGLVFGASGEFPAAGWRGLNAQLGARMPAREIRAASASLGQNFLQAVLAYSNFPLLREGLAAAKAPPAEPIHHAPAFGLAAGLLKIDEGAAVGFYLHQLLTNSISACQRLMPLGQTAAGRILWNLKPAILAATSRSAEYVDGPAGLANAPCFTPLVDWAAMGHPALSTRLFVS